jgi:signal transduction histidine kinase/DNA-binding response OmpR family regulator
MLGARGSDEHDLHEQRSHEIDSAADGVSWITGGGEMGALIRAFDWSQTPIGPMENWSPTLRVMVRFMLANRFPLLLWWGPQYVSIYNDAYRPVLGTKHPWALGKPVSECWSEIWHILKPLIDSPFNGGPATWNEDIELEINRQGFLEETHFTIAYSPVPDEAAANGVGGVLATVAEITEKVVAERRVVILRDLAARTGDARSPSEACAIAVETLARHEKDVPFALLYLLDSDCKLARLAGATGVERGQALSPETVNLSDKDVGEGWHFADVAAPVVVDDLPTRFSTVSNACFSDLPHTAVVLPIAALNPQETTGFLVVGVTPRLRLDDRYHDFLQLIKAQIASAIANARSYEEERKRSEALAEIDRAKTVFFSNVSHEFRTPLTLMLGHIEEIISSSGLRPGDRDRLVIAHRNSLRMLKLVNTLLEFSRIEAGRVRAVFEPTDLGAATTELASVFRSATEKAGLSLVVDAPPLPEPAHVDRQMWEKVVLNLLSNAFKFTLRGEIAVKLGVDQDSFVLTVRDTGIGIPAEEMPRLFERFHRVEGAEGRTQEGSGIGLAFVQELVRLHGGSVSAESRIGKGTTFRVSIPRGSSHLPLKQTGNAKAGVSTAIGATPFIEEALGWLPNSADRNAGLPEVELDAPPANTRSSDGRAFLLVVDDNADMRDYLRRLLTPHYELEIVGDGDAALAASARRKPDLVLTDIMIPGLNGLELLHRLRSDPRTNTTPIILLSARAGEENRIEGIRAGADDYLIKPFSARELLARVEAHLKMSSYRIHATETLRASEERFRAFVTANSDVVYRLSPDWGEVLFLQGKDFIADIGNPTENWLAKYIHADDHTHVMAAIADAIRNKAAFELEHRIIRVDGSLGWAYSRAIPILGADEDIIEWFGAVRDITDRKRAEETQQLLLSELNHRVKNMLASVHAIAQQTLRRARDPAAFADSFSGRLQSMSRIHSLLTSTGWDGADLREVVRDQLLPGAVEDRRVIASGAAVRLEPQMALHTAMILHELGTNSVKYGALSKPDGIVSVSWVVNGDSLCLDWRERGGPPIKVPVGRGFGTKLIEQTVKGQGGTAGRLIEADGMHWQITLPLAAADGSASNAPSNIRKPLPQISESSAVLATASIKGKKFAVVEDEPLIAIDIASVLERDGAQVSGPVATVSDALDLIEESELDGALIDANLRGQPVGQIAAALTRKRIPFVFVTGYGREALPSSFVHAKILKKPFTERQLLEAAAELVEQPRAVLRLRD